MILLCGIPSEPPICLVAKAAEELGTPFVLFNQRESHHAEIYLELDAHGQMDGMLHLHATNWPLHAFTGVYARLMDHHDLPENKLGRTGSPSPNIQKSFLFHEALAEWLEIAPIPIMNRMRAMGSNGSKPYQAQWIARAGFRVPPTLITNDPEEVKAFLDLHTRIVYKSMSAIRSIVKELDTARLPELDKIRNLPTQFQAYIPGVNIRVHIVGDAVFATEIQSNAVDYRYAHQEGWGVEMTAVDLPDEIQATCVRLSQMLDLPLCGIDLKRTPDGEYYCFEANPSPGYSYFQQHTGQNIAAAIVHYLQQPQGSSQ